MTLDVLPVWLTAFGTLAVAIAAIWGDWIRASFGKLALELCENDGDLVNKPANQVYYRHLKVVNKRRWPHPKNCRVLLKAMSRRGPNGIFQPIPMSVPLQFIWPPQELTPSAITILGKQAQTLDFGLIREGKKCFEPRLYWTPQSFAGFVVANQAVRYSLQIVSDAYVSKTYQVFEVAFDGTWDAAQMQMHLTIREIVNDQ